MSGSTYHAVRSMRSEYLPNGHQHSIHIVILENCSDEFCNEGILDEARVDNMSTAIGLALGCEIEKSA